MAPWKDTPPLSSLPDLLSRAQLARRPGPIHNFRGYLPSDYQAGVTYWIRLWVANGRINGNLQRWEWWSSGGVFGKVVAAIIGPNVELGAIRINQRLAGVLGTISLPFTPSELYYLPATQLFVRTELVSHTHNDVTIVVT